MRRPPVSNPDLLDLRATIVLSVAAALLTVQWMRGADLSFLTLSYPAWPQEPWRLLTACLLHVGLLHLVFNLYWTWRFGAILEPIFGLPAMAGILLLLGAGSSAVQWGLSGPGVGLSGVGYGLFGLAWALDRYHPTYRGILDQRTTQMFVVWFFLCVLATWSGMMPIGNEAHAGGAVLGGLLGLALSPWPRRRRAGRAGLAAAVVLAALLATVLRPYVNYSGARAWELAYDGYVALAAGDAATAARRLEASLEREPAVESSWHNLGVAYTRLGRGADAEEAFRRAEQAAASARSADADRADDRPFPFAERFLDGPRD